MKTRANKRRYRPNLSQVVVQTTTILQQRCSLQLIQSSFRHLRSGTSELRATSVQVLRSHCAGRIQTAKPFSNRSKQGQNAQSTFSNPRPLVESAHPLTSDVRTTSQFITAVQLLKQIIVHRLRHDARPLQRASSCCHHRSATSSFASPAASVPQVRSPGPPRAPAPI